MASTVVIPGIHGAQQRAIATAFTRAGWHVRGTARGPGADLQADFDTGEGLEAAFAGADAVVFTVPQAHRDGAMERMARHVVDAADRSGVGRLIVNLATRAPDDADGPVFSALRDVRTTVMAAATPAVVLQTTVYMDNLLAPWSLPAIVGDGVLAYPASPDARVSWLSHQTLGDAALAVATHDDLAGRTIDIGGPDPLSGTELADRLGRHLGRPLEYVALPLDAFAAGLDQAFGAPAGDRIASLYRNLQRHPDALTVDPAWAQMLGVTPEPFETFAARVDWRTG